MPAPRYRSRTYRRVFVRTPGGKTVLHYKRRKPGKAQCAGCGKVLAGVSCARKAKLRKIAKSSRRPSRPFGGVLCAACARKEIIKKARAKK